MSRPVSKQMGPLLNILSGARLSGPKLPVQSAFARLRRPPPDQPVSPLESGERRFVYHLRVGPKVTESPPT